MGFSIVQILAVLLAVSIAGDAALGWLYLAKRDEVAKTGVQLEQANTSALECSAHTDDLYQRAEQLQKDGAIVRAAAAASAAGHEQWATQILATPASTPGDACKSAADLAHDWLRKRSKP